MLIVSYDISNNKLRTKFSKFLEKHGYRLQYSVFELNHSTRLLGIIKSEIEGKFSKKFEGSDSVLIFSADEKKTIKYGNAIHRDEDLVVF